MDKEDYAVLPKLFQAAEKRGFTLLIKTQVNLMFCEFHTDSSFMIDQQANTYKCEALVSIKECKAGSIDKKGSLSTNYPYYDWLSISPLDTECRDCALLPACGGGCPALIYEEYATYHKYQKSSCYLIKYVVRNRIKYCLSKKYPNKIDL